jgi:carbon storage regulator
VINDDIVVTVTKIRGNQVHLAFQAPVNTPIHRQEVYDAIAGKKRTDRPLQVTGKRLSVVPS